ncbi:MAG: 3-oxoadipate enol-lactonase [Pseudomonadota bacterium]
MQVADLGDGFFLSYRIDGPDDGAPVVFSNSLGTDLRLWDDMVQHLPSGLRLVRYDKRGHGLSSCPRAPYSMGTLVGDLERLLDLLQIKNAVIVGCSIGGLIAQGLAAKRMDQVRAMVLSNTAAKIGTRQTWDDRIAQIRAGGIEAIGDATMERWFSKAFRATPEMQAWRAMCVRQSLEGYIGCASAISGTDFITPTSGLTLPTLVVAGSEDGATPPDLVRETAELIKGSRFELMRKVGHLPMVEDPKGFAELLTGFLNDIGHV